jgi:hypothetical protein
MKNYIVNNDAASLGWSNNPREVKEFVSTTEDISLVLPLRTLSIIDAK